LLYLVKFRACMWAWDRYGPPPKSSVPDISFVSSFWILGFVFAIASAPCDFLYLNNEYMIYINKSKKAPYLLDSLRYLVFLSRLLYFRI